MGDEVDQYFGSLYKKSPNADMSVLGEIKLTKDKLKRWFSRFPCLKVATSNHGQRWAKKASEAEIPSVMIRHYTEVLEIPPTWSYRDVWILNGSKQKFMMKHGVGYGGQCAYKEAPFREGMSVVFGHLHSSAGMARVKTDGYEREIWGMNVGCLIDVSTFAFEYERNNKFKPNVGTGVILNGGTTPIWLPLET